MSEGRYSPSLALIAAELPFGRDGNSARRYICIDSEEEHLAKVFFSYSHVDEAMRDQLEVQLAMLTRQGIIEPWHDRRIGPGEEFDNVISAKLDEADIVLLLVSPDFLASNYCYDRELQRAVERHESGVAVIIPVILRACDWHESVLGKFNAVPADGRPIKQAVDQDQAFLEVSKAIRTAASRFGTKAGNALGKNLSTTYIPDVVVETKSISSGELTRQLPRSSNLRVAKKFTERDRDIFKIETFEYISRFFEGSLIELSNRNEQIECIFRQIDANRFTSTAYISGKSVAKCTIFMSGDRGYFGGICYTPNETTESNSYNESMNVESDDHSMFLKSTMSSFVGRVEKKLSQEGAAEFLWAKFIEPLQRQI